MPRAVYGVIWERTRRAAAVPKSRFLRARVSQEELQLCWRQVSRGPQRMLESNQYTFTLAFTFRNVSCYSVPERTEMLNASHSRQRIFWVQVQKKGRTW